MGVCYYLGPLLARRSSSVLSFRTQAFVHTFVLIADVFASLWLSVMVSGTDVDVRARLG